MEIEYVFEPTSNHNNSKLSSNHEPSSSDHEPTSNQNNSVNLLFKEPNQVTSKKASSVNQRSPIGSMERVKPLDDNDDNDERVEFKVGKEAKFFRVPYEHCMNSNMLKAMLDKYDSTLANDPIVCPLLEPIDFELIIEYWDIISYGKSNVSQDQVNTSIRIWLQHMDVPRLTSLLLTASYLAELSLMNVVCVHLKALYQKGKNVAEYCALLNMRVPDQDELARLSQIYAPRFALHITKKEGSPKNSKKRSSSTITETITRKKSRK